MGEAEEFEFKAYQGCLDSKQTSHSSPPPNKITLCYGAITKQR